MENQKKEIMTILVKCTDSVYVKGQKKGVAMVNFTAETTGEYFTGKLIGNGVDTQNIYGENNMTLSARYMLEGKDCEGCDCRIFIENNGSDFEHCKPEITTDSKALAFLEDADLSATVEIIEGGVKIHIFNE